MGPPAMDVFAGCGGLSLGLVRSGFDVRVAVDNNRYAVATHRKNLSSHVIEGDVHKLKIEDLLRVASLGRGECALLVGGPPCQGFSVQRRNPVGDPRNDLIFEFLRLVEGVRPAFFLMENVQGLKGGRSGQYWKSFLTRAARLGYYCQWRILDAVEYRVPQFRRRLFVIGEFGGFDSPHFVFPESTSPHEQWRTVRDAIGDLPSPPKDFMEHSQWANHRRTRMSPLNIRRISFVPEGGGWEHIPERLRLPCHQPGAARIGHRYVYGRMSWDKPAPSLTARFDSFTRGKFAHPSENRSITLREGARIQTFPDDFVFEGTQEEIASQIGNAVPPILAQVLGRALLEAYIRRMQGMEIAHSPRQMVLIQ